MAAADLRCEFEHIMTATSILENRIQFNQVAWLAATLVAVVFLGFYLAYDSFTAIFAMAGFMWMITLPYHSRISVYLAVATFSSALIVPFFPGRPTMWEFAAVLGWSGVLVTLFMRQYAVGFAADLHRHRWIFIGIVGYILVLISIMFYRGVGFRVFGSSQMGGRYYFQQIVCAVFPLLFIIFRPSEKMVTRLLILQCFLSLTFVLSDFVWSRAPRELQFIMQFFELPGDAVNYEIKAQSFGLRRYQSFREAGQGLLFFLLIRYSLVQFTGRKGLFLLPLSLAIFLVGLLSGHRILVLICVTVFIFCGYSQRFFSWKHVLVGLMAAACLVGTSYLFADQLPKAIQRGLSFLPGISIDADAFDDGYGTMVTRRVLRQIGWEMVPDYLWMGRGFGMVALDDNSVRWDPTLITVHINQGRFYNGVIGLLVNTGFLGTLFMMILLGAGTLVAWGIIRKLRVLGHNDNFLRTCGLVSGFWMLSVISFIFLHGDSEFALKSFSLQVGLLIVCQRHLDVRITAFKGPSGARRLALNTPIPLRPPRERFAPASPVDLGAMAIKR